MNVCNVRISLAGAAMIAVGGVLKIVRAMGAAADDTGAGLDGSCDEVVAKVAVKLSKLWKAPSCLAKASLLQALCSVFTHWGERLQDKLDCAIVVAADGVEDSDFSVRRSARECWGCCV